MKPKQREVRVVTLIIISLLLFGLLFLTCILVGEADPEEDVVNGVREFSNLSIAKRDSAAIVSTLTPDFHTITSLNAEVSESQRLENGWAANIPIALLYE